MLPPYLSLLVSAHRAEPLSRVLIVIYITSRAYENARLLLRERDRERMEEEEEEEEMEGGEEKGLNGTILPSSNFLTSRVRVPYRRDNGRFRWGECNRFILFRENFFFLYPLLVLRYRVFAFFVDVGLLGNYQSGSSDRKYPALRFKHLSLSLSLARWNAHTHTIAFRLLPPLHPFFSLSRSALSFSFPVYSDSVHLGILVCYVHRPICSIKAFDWLAGQRDHALFSKREIYRSSSNRNHLFFPLFGAFPPNV